MQLLCTLKLLILVDQPIQMDSIATHVYGSAIGTLSVDLWDASTGTNLATVLLPLWR